MIRRRTCARLLGAGALAFAALALSDPRRVAEMVGDDEAMARTLGARDLGSGLRLVLAPHPEGPILERIVLDVSDALIFGRSRPKVAVVALGYAALGVLAARAPR